MTFFFGVFFVVLIEKRLSLDHSVRYSNLELFQICPERMWYCIDFKCGFCFFEWHFTVRSLYTFLIEKNQSSIKQAARFASA